ncbi:MAG: DUF2207 domain-containing protein [Mycobacterium sp.]|nr:DUF2207 domain-containing protein [Mycobacterium sp.]
MYRVERMGNFQRIWIGNPDYFLNYGVHTYTIRYTMTRMARAFDDHDELYWNATGNYWVFPILAARATVTLPDGAVISDVAAIPASPARPEQAVADQAHFRHHGHFPRQSGAGGRRGHDHRCRRSTRAWWPSPTGLDALLQQRGDLSEGVLPLWQRWLAVAYNALARVRVSAAIRKRASSLRLFHAPEGFSPRWLHYVHKWGFDNPGWTALTAAIFSLGVKGRW